MNYDINYFIEKNPENLISHKCQTITSEKIYKPNPNILEEIFTYSDRSIPVLNNLSRIYNHGNLSKTGYLSILPVDQGIEHSAGASFAKNPIYFNPENLIKLAIEGGCNAIASTIGTLGLFARKYSYKIPFIVKLNHNELLSYPNSYDQVYFGQIKQAVDMGAAAIGATIYFGSPESKKQIEETSKVFYYAHQNGLATILWCYLRNPFFKVNEVDYHKSADLTGQANYIGVNIEADIIKQKLPENNMGYLNIKNFGATDDQIYKKLTTDHPIDLARYQLLNNFMGNCPLISSGGPSSHNDSFELVRSAIINKRSGGSGLIAGRKIFQKSMKEGIKLLNEIQEVYLDSRITIS